MKPVPLPGLKLILALNIAILPNINNLCFPWPRCDITSTMLARKRTSRSMHVAVTEERVVVIALSENKRDIGSVDGPDRQAELDIPSSKTN